MASPTPSIRYSTRAKIVIVLVLAVATGAFVLAGMTAVTDENPGFTVSGSPAEEVVGDEAVDALVPAEDSQVLSQQRFGIDLAPGWTGELLFLPADGVATPLPADEFDEIEELNQIFYEPGQGKTIERLPQGTNCVVATIWSRVRGRDASERVEQWCFRVF